MHPIKRLILGVALLLLLLVVVAFALPQHITVARSKVINAPESDVFPYVNSLKRFNEWSPWAARDPETKYVFSGPEEGEGARMEWSSNNPEVGSGAQEIIESQPNALVRVNLNFGDMGKAKAAYQLKPSGAGTRIVWVFDTNVGNNPVQRWMGLMFDRWVGQDYEAGLERLKKRVESAR
ncbi:MAG: SRPBCC family protein [Methyloligellaceae bacterium]